MVDFIIKYWVGVYNATSSNNDSSYTNRANIGTSGTARLAYSSLVSFQYMGSVTSKCLLNGSQITLERVY